MVFAFLRVLVAGERRQEPPEGIAESGYDEIDRLWGGGIPARHEYSARRSRRKRQVVHPTLYATAAAQRGEVAAGFNFDETLSTIYPALCRMLNVSVRASAGLP